jgi:hypothetical protein
LTSSTGPSAKGQQKNISKLIGYFNHERNVNGEYCRVILGSKIISEGFTFKNVRHIHILTLHWNYTETQQAIARAIRYGSHRMLMDHPNQSIPVMIYQYVCLPTAETPSIGLQMLDVAQRKDIVVRRMTRVIKEISFDCPLVYERNVAEGSSYRDCDYNNVCEYRCDQCTPSNEPLDMDVNTYRLYYQESSDLNVWNAVRRFFRGSTGLPVDLYMLQDQLQVDDWFQLVRVLSTMIRFNTPVINAYGVECFIREDRNLFYLVDNILLPNNAFHLSWYTHHPTIMETQTLDQFLQTKGFPIYAQRIAELRANFSFALLNTLPVPLRELYKTLQQQSRQENVQSEQQIFRVVQERNLPYYGTVDQADKFRIVDVRTPGDVTDVRKMKSGSVCLESGFNKDRIVRVYFALGVDVPLPEGFREKYPDPEALVRSMKYGPELLAHPELALDPGQPEAFREALYQIIYLLAMGKGELCRTLREWMRENDLLALIVSEVKGTRKSKLKDIRV